MSQHDFNIANQGFPSFRADLNNALVALATTSSGTAEPATTYANQLWYETDTNTLHIRDEANSAWLDLMVINQTTGSPSFTAGNVGIGTASPSTNLHVNQAGATAGEYGIRIGQAGFTSNFGAFNIDTTGSRVMLESSAAYPIAFDVNGSERMRIDSSGNVGIGTSSPGYLLHVQADASPIIASTDTTNTITTIVNSSNTAGVLGTATNHPLALVTNNTERARIDSSGNLLVGTTTANGALSVNPTGATYTGFFVGAADGFNIACRGGSTTGTAIRILNGSGTAVGSITYTASATAYNTSSDYRLKENVQPMQDALAKIAQLNPVTYTWKADGSAGQGFIAHELQAVVPDCVTGEKDAVDAGGNPQYQGVDTSFLVATLVKAIQELKAEVDSLRAQLNP